MKEHSIVQAFTDAMRPVQLKGLQVMGEAKRDLLAAGFTPQQASEALAAALAALKKERMQ